MRFVIGFVLFFSVVSHGDPTLHTIVRDAVKEYVSDAQGILTGPGMNSEGAYALLRLTAKDTANYLLDQVKKGNLDLSDAQKVVDAEEQGMDEGFRGSSLKAFTPIVFDILAIEFLEAAKAERSQMDIGNKFARRTNAALKVATYVDGLLTLVAMDAAFIASGIAFAVNLPPHIDVHSGTFLFVKLAILAAGVSVGSATWTLEKTVRQFLSKGGIQPKSTETLDEAIVKLTDKVSSKVKRCNLAFSKAT